MVVDKTSQERDIDAGDGDKPNAKKNNALKANGKTEFLLPPPFHLLTGNTLRSPPNVGNCDPGTQLVIAQTTRQAYIWKIEYLWHNVCVGLIVILLGPRPEIKFVEKMNEIIYKWH